MILLSGHSLTQARKVPLESLSLRLSERESTASMVPVMMDGIGIDSWLMDDTEPGRGIVWRVRSIQTAYATDTPTVQLEHVINCLKDRILFGEHEPSAMGGSDTATAEQAIRYALQRQGDWRLGRCEFNFSAPYKFNGESIYDCIQKVTGTLDGAWWDLDTSTYPFVLNIIRKPAGAACELRPGRNLSALSRQIDTSGMITRFYPIGKDDLHIPTEYVSLNEAAYGVHERVEVDQEIETVEELTSWANEYLRKHAQPVVTVTAEGLELADATGESLDRLTLGRICRIPLQEFGTTIEERITQVEYTDKLRQPEKVRITMSNQETDRDILRLIADEIKSGGGRSGRGGRGAAKQSKEDHAWFEDTDHHVAMVAVGIIGKDASGKPNWQRLSRLEVNEDGIYGEVKSVQNDVVIAQTAIRQNENAIELEAKRAVSAEGQLSGRITVEADRITQEVTRASAAEGQLSGRITVEAGKISQVVSAVGADGRVTAASIVTAINNGSSSIQLKADHIDIDGLVTRLQSKDIQCYGIEASTGTFDDYCYAGLAFQTPYGNLGVRDVTASGNTLTIRYADGRPDVNFSKATTLTLNWSGGVCTGIAKQNGTEVARKTSPISVSGSNEITSNGQHTYKVMYEDSAGEDIETGCQKTITVNVSHSPTASATTGWTGSISGRTSLGSITGSSSARTYILIDAKCGGSTKGYYITVN